MKSQNNIKSQSKEEETFLNSLSDKANNENFHNEEIIFSNYYDSSSKVEQFKHFKKIEQIEKNIAKYVRKSVKDFLNLEKNNDNLIPKESNIDLKNLIKDKMELINNKTEKALLDIISKENIS